MKQPSLEDWTAHLRSIADDAPSEPPAALGDLTAPFLAATGRHHVSEAAPTSGLALETALWWASVDNSVDVDSLLTTAPDGPLLPRDRYRTIEVWTEAELTALHALWRLARDRDRPDWRDRIAGARSWHLEHTEPDNATNRPWALHVFLLAGTPEGTHYAGTMTHNYEIAGKDAVSTLILWDVIDELARLHRG